MSRLTAAFSTSSPLASVAIFDETGNLLWSAERFAPNGASGALPTMLTDGLADLNALLSDCALFVADLGPGSFTGVRVGIVFAKVLAYAARVMAGGAPAFDLIDPTGPSFVPSRRDEVYVRVPGESPLTMAAPPTGAVGYEFARPGKYPRASGFGPLLSGLVHVSPFELVPAYLAEPSISRPKRPYAEPRG